MEQIDILLPPTKVSLWTKLSPSGGGGGGAAYLYCFNLVLVLATDYGTQRATYSQIEIFYGLKAYQFITEETNYDDEVRSK